METENRPLPDFCYDPNRTFTFNDAEELITCAEQRSWKKEIRPKYVVRPILNRIPSLAITKEIEPKKVDQPEPSMSLTHFPKSKPKRRIKPERSQSPVQHKCSRRNCFACDVIPPHPGLPKIFHKLSVRKRRLESLGRLNTSRDFEKLNETANTSRLERSMTLP